MTSDIPQLLLAVRSHLVEVTGIGNKPWPKPLSLHARGTRLSFPASNDMAVIKTPILWGTPLIDNIIPSLCVLQHDQYHSQAVPKMCGRTHSSAQEMKTAMVSKIKIG